MTQATTDGRAAHAKAAKQARLCFRIKSRCRCPAFEAPARHEDQASASARSAPASLLHLWKGSSAAVAIEFHAREQSRAAVAVARPGGGGPIVARAYAAPRYEIRSNGHASTSQRETTSRSAESEPARVARTHEVITASLTPSLSG